MTYSKLLKTKYEAEFGPLGPLGVNSFFLTSLNLHSISGFLRPPKISSYQQMFVAARSLCQLGLNDLLTS